MVVTVLCAGLTVVFFIITNVNEAQWKFGEEESTVEISSEKHVFINPFFVDHGFNCCGCVDKILKCDH